MVKKADVRARLIEAALACAARQGWARMGLADVAAEAGVPLAEVLGHYRSKTAILDAFARRIDDEVVAAAGAEEADQPARDRLFEVVMRRFDALAPHKTALRAIVRDRPRDPLVLACAGAILARSMATMLEAARISSDGLVGLARANGLAVIYAAAFRAWLGDETEDLGPTMAALDRNLRRAEALFGRRPSGRRRAAEAASASEPKPQASTRSATGGGA